MTATTTSTSGGAPGPRISIADAAAERGVSVETFIGWMVDSAMLLEHPNGGYVPVPHPHLVELAR